MTRRVLVVDDDALLLSAMVRRFHGVMDLHTAACGADAVAAVSCAQDAGIPFAVVVCDMRMPGMDGIETLAAIRGIAPDTVRIMLTGNADQQTAVDAINRGAILRFYTKPCPHEELLAGIEAGLRQFDLLSAERRLVENEERWRLALAAVGDGAWDWNPVTGHLVCSEGWSAMLGARDGGGSPASEADWWALLHPEDAARTSSEIDHLLRGERSPLVIEHRLRAADGRYPWFLTRGVVFARDAQGRAVRVVGTCTDITERKRLEDALQRSAEELRLLATTDSLTGLWNRRAFLEKAEAELARNRRYGRPLSLLMVDIDFFKRVNDTHGHAAGDAVLSAFAGILRSGLRKTDIIGRIGGEEFAVMLPETNLDRALVAAENLRAAVAAAVIAAGGDLMLSITASLGATGIGPGGGGVAEGLRRADEALYRAKCGGRNRVEADSPTPVRSPAG